MKYRVVNATYYAAVAAMLNKPLIIIDEPTSALDAGSTGKVLSFSATGGKGNDCVSRIT